MQYQDKNLKGCVNCGSSRPKPSKPSGGGKPVRPKGHGW